ncbi:carbohydrate sulfotransferase 4 isoform X2 [Procambarus clarkii]|uniref:carbohydrate sulfotransferase 4 isoform X2 n=1 Tax=Procambarus clarkii TaxID=6728 RepID=UPI00374253BA
MMWLGRTHVLWRLTRSWWCRRPAWLTVMVGVSGMVCLMMLSRSTTLAPPLRPSPPGARVVLAAAPPARLHQDLDTSQDTAGRGRVVTSQDTAGRGGVVTSQDTAGRGRVVTSQDTAGRGRVVTSQDTAGRGGVDTSSTQAGGGEAGAAWEDAGPEHLGAPAAPHLGVLTAPHPGAPTHKMQADAAPGEGPGTAPGTEPEEEAVLGGGQEEEEGAEEAGLRDEILSEVHETMEGKIEAILKRKREALAIDMEGYHFHPHLKAKDVSDLVMERGGNPVRSLVVTTWRSGSTFIGDVLQSHPATFYHYEPLLDFGISQIREGKLAEQAIYSLRHLLTCNYTNMESYLEYGPMHPWLFFHNLQLWSYCKAFPDLCWLPQFLEPFCQLFPFQAVKTVRLRLNLTRDLLQDDKLGVQVVLLVRDPRGTMQSRAHRNWCPGNADCDDPARLCDDLVNDYNTARIFTRKFPHSFRVIRYEDFSFHAHNMTKDLFDFFHLDYHPRVQTFLDTHTTKKVGGVSSTFRNSKTAPVHWQQDLTWQEVVDIQKVCDKALKLWGYRMARYEKHLRSFNPVGKLRKGLMLL